MELRSTTRQLKHGHEMRTLSVSREQGSGWVVRCWVHWKGEDAGELHRSDSTWHDQEEDAVLDLQRWAMELEEMGWE